MFHIGYYPLFLMDIGGSDPIWDQRKCFIAYIEKINTSSPLLYTIIDGKGLQKRYELIGTGNS